ncbi:MAG: MmcQ/YjbR family DNA-binding protein [Actinomycetota bacterium]
MASSDRGLEALDEVRRICLALPETNERLSHGAPCFFIRDKKAFVYFHEDFHGDDMVSIWCPAPPGVQEQMVEAEPDRFFRPPYLGVKGWLGVRLDVEPDWDEVAEIVEDGFRKVAPTTVVRQLGDAT